jgi:hypothetical protein
LRSIDGADQMAAPAGPPTTRPPSFSRTVRRGSLMVWVFHSTLPVFRSMPTSEPRKVQQA